jgi:Glycosyltransferase family 9 (heptosyltransferase)
LVAQRNGRVILEVRPELYRLFEGFQGVETLISYGEPLPAFDVQCPLMSLPLVFKTTMDTIPSKTPYLHERPDLAKQWHERFANSKKLGVGLIWGGNPTHASDRMRSIPPDVLRELSSVSDVSFVSLQKGEPAKRRPPAEMNLSDWTSELHDFADTAALVANLDLIITVDTSVAHLAGAMGKRTWVLLPFSPDWRWFLNRDDSPWYPSVRLFRQQTPGSWTAPVGELRNALVGLSRTFSAT